MEKFQEFKSLINGNPLKIVITTHHKPDADALGSSLGLASYLKAKGHNVIVITPTDYPEFLYWMGGHKDVVIYNFGNEKKSERLCNEADLIFSLDYNNLSRINELGKAVANSNANKVLIDHHLDPDDFADFEFWSVKAAATAELVYELIVKLGDKSFINRNIAECLYAGIMTDTGGFRHSNTSKNVHLITAELIQAGADVTKVSKLIYDNSSLERLKFIGYALSEKLQVLPEYRVAYFAITAAELKRFSSKTGDTEGLVNYALSIKGINMAALIIDRTEAVKMSFRSIGNFSVNEFAQKHFNGGGHKNAAGGRSEESLETTVKKFEEALKEYKDELLEKPDVVSVS
ncbi:MAG: bifunctional oligoribonuclease/PAP phosphatase NrnA [Bacteroidota bacterium]